MVVREDQEGHRQDGENHFHQGNQVHQESHRVSHRMEDRAENHDQASPHHHYHQGHNQDQYRGSQGSLGLQWQDRQREQEQPR